MTALFKKKNLAKLNDCAFQYQFDYLLQIDARKPKCYCQKFKLEVSPISQKYSFKKRIKLNQLLIKILIKSVLCKQFSLYLPSSVTVEWLRSVTDTCLLVFRTGTSLFFESKRHY